MNWGYMKEKQRRLVGSDGELVVPMAVEKPKRKPDDPSLTRRLALVVLVLIVLFGGAALAVVVAQTVIKAAVPVKPSLATIPARFVKGAYNISFAVDIDKAKPVTLPCTSRRISVHVEGRTPVTVHLWATPDHGSFDFQASITASERSTVFDIPAQQGDMFNIEAIDSQGSAISGAEKIAFGTNAFPVCEIGITFESLVK